MSSVGPRSLSALFVVPEEYGIPEFPRDSNFDYMKYQCIKCKRTLLPPVMQLICGHRMCGTCLDNIRHSLENKHCPGDEPECKETDVTIPNHVYPDVGATRELSRAVVFCYNKHNGCPEKHPWSVLIHSHIGNCLYVLVDCKYKANGCPERKPKANIETHEAQCLYVFVKCPHCEKNVLKLDMQRGHSEQCSLQQKQCSLAVIGCPYVASTRDELRRHLHENVSSHLFLIRDVCMAVGQSHQELSSYISETGSQHSGIIVKINDITESNKEMRSKLENKVRNTQKMTAKNSEKLEEMKSMGDQLTQVPTLQESRTTIETKVAALERGVGGSGVPREFVSMAQSKESLIATQNDKISNLEVRFQCLEATSFDGFFIWKITNYSQHKQKAVNNEVMSVYSQPFYSSPSGYKMCLRLYPNGDGMGKGSHVSFYLVIMKGEFDALLTWPFRQRVSFTLMDLETHRRSVTDTFRPDPTSASFHQPRGEMNVASGFPLFIQQSKLGSSSIYVKDDTIFVKAVVEM